MLDWDDLRIFLAIARSGSFVSTGRGLGLNHTTLARRLTGLETALGTRLFDRSPRGVVPTRAGLDLIAHATRIEEEILAAGRRVEGLDGDVSGVVRLATPEAFGTYFMAPRARLLHARHPRIELELVPESRNVNLSKREADIAISLNRPQTGRLQSARLVDYRIGLYASADLLARIGPVDTPAALKGQPFISYIEEMIDLPELRNLESTVSETCVFRSSSVAAQMEAVVSGLGFGLLHCFAVRPHMRVVRVLPEAVEVVRSYWMVLHADLARVPRIRAVADFVAAQVRAEAAAF
ncbi:LysR family transcriptional regulator [Sphingomonas ginsenosidivorax]|uniref:LysR family transcriptional regulator n=1 Tax=Sphingomonas ginsenosidivorax TaxID=862135 RepID=A0A5C6UC70_9SPHN|nr:LysR family transcriptional regulator [Sphingomonas ginsenosidivorax]TXC70302.1 LysR family transcriptional regulator [Sphingomonas ginsenosidivorax]